MKIDLTGDYYEDIGIKTFMHQLYNNKLSNFFKDKNYGNDDVEIFMVIVSYPKDLKQRIRYAKKDKVLYYDIILDYKMLKNAGKDAKKRILANSIIKSFDIVNRYKLNINSKKLKEDAESFFINLGWLLPSSLVIAYKKQE